MLNNLQWRQASSNYSSTTQCLFVKKITQQMIDDDVFPSLLTNGGYYGGRTLPSIVAGRKTWNYLG